MWLNVRCGTQQTIVDRPCCPVKIPERSPDTVESIRIGIRGGHDRP